MSAPTPFTPLSHAQVLDLLAEGHAGGTTVVTPNARLAQSLARDFDAAQAARPALAWETADVLPLAALVERLYEDALYAGTLQREGDERLPVLLTAVQEQALWEQAIEAGPIGGGELLALSATAGEAQAAWTLAQQWNIAAAATDPRGPFVRSEDTQALAQWAAHYARRCEREGCIDAARLPDLVTRLLPALALPRRLVAYGFDRITPQAEALLRALAARGVDVRAGTAAPHAGAAPIRAPFTSAREEIEGAARWARARLEAATARGRVPRIGIVVPDLGQRRKSIVQALAKVLAPSNMVLAPATNLPGREAHALPFNLSLGQPLSEFAQVHAALGWIAMAAGEADYGLVSRLLRSPFIAGAEQEAMARARLDAQLRRSAAPRAGLAQVTAWMAPQAQAVPVLHAGMGAALDYARRHLAGRRPAHEWAQHFAALLGTLGFPGERALNSAEYQAQAKWTETLAQFARLSRVLPPLSAREAAARLSRLCAGTVFQPENRGAPIQVLGVLESSGMAFDHLWVCGLTDEAWPLAPRPSPFLPLALQKKAGIPEASAEGALAQDRRRTEAWLGAAPEVVLSHALREEDRELGVSVLIAALPEGRPIGPEGRPEIPAYPVYRDVLFAARALERQDGAAAQRAPALMQPALSQPQVRGGARVLADQAACPFRAFARHRLGARALEAPVSGLDAAARGNLLHALMKGIWDELKTKQRLDDLPRGELAAVIERAARAALNRIRRERSIEDGFAELERARLCRLAAEWLEVERARGGFEVAATEEKRTLQAGGLTLSGRIDRLDRLEGGDYALIDYKTGRPTPRAWRGPRPDDPQLPLYAVSAEEPISAVAFARLKTGDMRMMGFSRDAGVMPKVAEAKHWPNLMMVWKAEVDALGASFAAGEAVVDPKKGIQTCRNCDLAPLCRVHEKFSPLELDIEEGLDEDAP